MFETEKEQIFAPTSVLSFTKPKYSSEGIEALFKEKVENYKAKGRLLIEENARFKEYDELTMRDITVRCGVTTYDYKKDDILWFCSYKKSIWDVPIIHAILSTSAAPAYFPIHVFKVGPREYNCIDGGVWGNDPSLYALYMERVRNRLDRFRTYNIIAIGTGQQDPEKVKPPLFSNQSRAGWGVGTPPIYEVQLNASAKMVSTMVDFLSQTGTVFSVKLQISFNTWVALDDLDLSKQDECLKEETAQFTMDLTGAVNLTMMMGKIRQYELEELVAKKRKYKNYTVGPTSPTSNDK